MGKAFCADSTNQIFAKSREGLWEGDKVSDVVLVKELAAKLWHARIHGGKVPRVAFPELASVDEGYAVQRDSERLARLPRAGWKVGATSISVQALFGIDQPATAPMFEPFCFISPATVPILIDQHTNLEAEFAFQFGDDLPPRKLRYDREEILAAVAAVVPAIEIVGCRFEGGFERLGAMQLVADMTAHSAFVRGQPVRIWQGMDLRTHPVALRKNNRIVAKGVGANVLGDPIAVLEWAANHLSTLGEPILTGEIVTTGTCTGLTQASPGDRFVADFAELGVVEVSLVRAGRSLIHPLVSAG